VVTRGMKLFPNNFISHVTNHRNN